MKKLMLLALVIVVTGCSPPAYWRSRTSVGQAGTDWWECDQAAKQAVASMSDPAAADRKAAELRDQCMRARGYQLLPRSEIGAGNRLRYFEGRGVAGY